jgi:hypothetical protein
MGQEPEELRAELAAKRDDLSRDMEAIGDRVSPRRAVERRQAAMRMRLSDMRERVMGSKEHAMERMHDGAHVAKDSMTDAASRAGEVARERTEGAPLAVGLMAFGAGLAAAALFPATRREQHLAQQAQPMVERAVAEVGPAAKQVVDDVRPAAEEAMHDLRDEAKQAASNVSEQAKAAAADVKDETAATARSS